MSDPHPTPPEPGSRIYFLDLLRGPAALFVMWDHLVAEYHHRSSTSWPPLSFVREQINRPLGIIQDFGFFGVALFFLISGFIITHVAQRETRASFVLRRLFRIYPPLIVSLLVALLVSALQQGKMPYSASELFWAGTLINYFRVPQVVVNGVAWTLVIEVIFYILVALLLHPVKRHPAAAVLAVSVLVAGVLATCRKFGDVYFLLAASTAYVPFLVVGQIAYYTLWARRLALWQGAALLLVQYGLLVWGLRIIHVSFLPVENSYLISFAYACLVFLLTLHVNDRLQLNRPGRRLAEMSYSIYLLHGSIGLGLLPVLVPHLGYWLSLMATTIVVLLASYASYRWIEAPSQHLGASLARPRHPQAS